MAWNWFKRRNEPLVNKESKHGKVGKVFLLPQEKNRWGMPVWDVRGVTLEVLSLTKVQEYAANSVSFGGDDGGSFLGQEPENPRWTKADLRYRRDRSLAEGSLFLPQVMEQKWVIFFRGGRILFVRSWLRKVIAVAEVEQSDEVIRVVGIRGTFVADDETPAFTVRVADFLLRSHVLGEIVPAPLPEYMAGKGDEIGTWCFSCYGNMALVASVEEPRLEVPERPLRSHSLLHIAAARGDVAEVGKQLAAGIPIDLLAGDGLTALQWALAGKDRTVAKYLLEHGCPVDVRSEQGATALMNAVQAGSIEGVNFLLDAGADVNATDVRGFTSLHRAAEMGKKELVSLLLAKGAVDVAAEGFKARSLAEKRGHQEIVDMLGR